MTRKLRPWEIQGERLRVLRDQRGLSQQEAAAVTGISQAMISQLESGVRRPRSSTLARFAKGYHMTLPALLGTLERDASLGPLIDMLHNDVAKKLAALAVEVDQQIERAKARK